MKGCIGTQPSGSRRGLFEDNIGQPYNMNVTQPSQENENEVDAQVVFAQPVQTGDQAQVPVGLHIPAQPDLQSEDRRTENTGSPQYPQYQFQPPSSEIFGPAPAPSNQGSLEDNVGQYNMNVTQSSQENENEVDAQVVFAQPVQTGDQTQVPVGLHTPAPARDPSNNPCDKPLHTTEKSPRYKSTLQSSKPKKWVRFRIFQLIMTPILVPVVIVLSPVLAFGCLVKLCLQKKPFFASPLSMGEKVLVLSVSLPLSVLLAPIMIILSPFVAYLLSALIGENLERKHRCFKS